MTAGPALIETLNELPADRVRVLLADSEATGSRIVRRLVEEWAAHTNRFDRPGEALFGAGVGGRLVGVCGLNIDPYAGDDRIGRVRRLYVLTGSRRLGIGKLLVKQVIDSARDRFDSLCLRTNAAAAARLYLGMGFRECTGMGEFTHVLQLARSSA